MFPVCVALLSAAVGQVVVETDALAVPHTGVLLQDLGQLLLVAILVLVVLLAGRFLAPFLFLLSSSECETRRLTPFPVGIGSKKNETDAEFRRSMRARLTGRELSGLARKSAWHLSATLVQSSLSARKTAPMSGPQNPGGTGRVRCDRSPGLTRSISPKVAKPAKSAARLLRTGHCAHESRWTSPLQARHLWSSRAADGLPG